MSPWHCSTDRESRTSLSAQATDPGVDGSAIGLFQGQPAAEGPFLATAGSTFFDGGSVDNLNGTISFVFDSLIGFGPGASGSGLLATISFLASGTTAGIGMFSLENIEALDSNLNVIDVQTAPLAVTVPEPESMLLLFTGLLALTWTRRARRLRA